MFLVPLVAVTNDNFAIFITFFIFMIIESIENNLRKHFVRGERLQGAYQSLWDSLSEPDFDITRFFRNYVRIFYPLLLLLLLKPSLMASTECSNRKT